jgi:predicted enzyme related to lactoylglutathione lyase
VAVRLHSLTFDCADPAALAAFWAAVTGYRMATASPFVAVIEGDGASAPRMMFIKVPEGKAAKNRVHLDLGTDDLEGEVERVLDLGAEPVGRYDEWGVRWATFRDPEGNEFCIGHHPVDEASQ